MNGIITSGQCASAIHDIPTVAELLDRIWAQARGLLREATDALDAVPATAG